MVIPRGPERDAIIYIAPKYNLPLPLQNPFFINISMNLYSNIETSRSEIQ